MIPVIPEGTDEGAETVPLASMSIESMFAEIEMDGEETPNMAQNPVVTNASVELQMYYETGMLDVPAVQYAFANLIKTEDKIEALKGLQSLIGRQELRKALFPTIQDLLESIEKDRREKYVGELAVEMKVRELKILGATRGLTKAALEDAINGLSRNYQKKSLLIGLRWEIGEKAFEEIIGA